MRAWAIHHNYDKARKAHPDLPEDGATVPMIFGSAFHKVVEDKAKNAKEIRKALDDVLGKSDPAYDSTYSGRDDVAKGLRVALNAFLADPQSAPWKDGSARLVEKKLSAEIDGIPVRGIMDCIDGDGMVIDIKTTTPRAECDYGSQLTTYWLMARENMEGIQDRAKVLKVFRPWGPKGKSGVLAERLSAKANEKHVRRLLQKVWALRETKKTWQKDYNEIESNPSAKRCRYCPAQGTSACPETRRW